MSIKLAENFSFTVKTDPVLELDNGIRIWLGEKGEQVQINSVAWTFISAAINNLQNIKVEK